MTKAAKIFLPIAALLFGLLVAIAIIKSRSTVERQPAEALPPLVRVMEVQPQDVHLVVRSQGTVRPLVESTLVAQVAGRIDWVAPGFAEGGYFERGDALVKVDPRDYELAVAQAEAQIAQAEVRLQLEQAEAALAREEWQELGSGEANPLALRVPQLAEARAAVQAAEAALARARLDLERTSVRTLFDGRIRAKLVDLGQFITRGTPVASVYSTQAAEIRLPVPRDQLPYVGLDPSLRFDPAQTGGPEVILRATIGRLDYEWTGRVVRTGSEFDPATRMLPLFARIEDPLRRQSTAVGDPLPMGLFVDAEIGGIELREVFVLPRSALRADSTVLVVDEESRLRIRAVDVARADRDRVYIQSGLAAADRVTVSQIEAVVDGMLVRTMVESPSLATVGEPEVGP